MYIVSAWIQNFCCFEDVVFFIDGQGLVYISGENLDTESADSNGSGKTTLFKAVTWGIFGETIDGESGDEIIRQGQKEAIVHIPLRDDEEKIWTICRSRKKGKPKLEILDPDENPLDLPKEKLQEKIIEWVGLDFQAFKNTALYGQNDSYRFADPRTKDAQRKEMLHQILRTSIFKDCHEWILAGRREVSGKLADKQKAVELVDAKIEEYDIKTLREKSAKWSEEQQQRVQEKRKRAAELIAEAKVAKQEASELDAILRKMKRVSAQMVQLSKAENEYKVTEKKLVADASKAQEQIIETGRQLALIEQECKQYRLSLEKLQGEHCPTCNSPLKGKAAKQHINYLRDSLNRRSSTGEPLRLALEAHQHSARELNQRLKNEHLLSEKRCDQLDKARREDNQLQNQLGNCKTAEYQYAKIKKLIAGYVREVEALEAASNPHADELKKAKTKLKGYIEERDKLVGEIEDLEEQLKYIEFWVRGFGVQGLPSFILDTVMPYLTERTNHYLGILADGDITMTFSTQTSLKSAKEEIRDRIGILWTIEGQEDVTPSGGQRKKMELATDLALMDLVATREGGHIDILMLDEVLDGLDQQGKARVMMLLKQLRAERGAVFVISHEAELAEAFEHVIHVKKESQVARLEAVA
jgi:DNA repair exonuclease SbcCD ATPase subunit